MALNITRAQADETTTQTLPLQSAILPFRMEEMSINTPISTPLVGQSEFLLNTERAARIRNINTVVNFAYKVGDTLNPIYNQTITPGFVLGLLRATNALDLMAYQFFQCRLIFRLEIVSSAAHQGLLGIAMWDGLLGPNILPPDPEFYSVAPDNSEFRRFYQQKPRFIRADKAQVIEFEVPFVYPLSSFSTSYNTRINYLESYPMKHIQIRPLVPLATKSEILQIPLKVTYRIENLTFSTPKIQS